MKRAIIACTLCAIVAADTWGQGSNSTGQRVDVSARGIDVRLVVHELFSQLGKNYVLDPAVKHQPLFLALKDVEFDMALQQICQMAELRCKYEKGIYHVSKIPKPAGPTVEKAQPVGKPDPKSGSTAAAPKGAYPASVLQRRITTRFTKTDLRELVQELSRQTGLQIEVDSRVPKYKVDAYLIDTSLKYALDGVTSAAKLQYRFTDRMTIEIVAPGTAKPPGKP